MVPLTGTLRASQMDWETTNPQPARSVPIPPARHERHISQSTRLSSPTLLFVGTRKRYHCAWSDDRLYGTFAGNTLRLTFEIWSVAGRPKPLRPGPSARLACCGFGSPFACPPRNFRKADDTEPKAAETSDPPIWARPAYNRRANRRRSPSSGIGPPGDGKPLLSAYSRNP